MKTLLVSAALALTLIVNGAASASQEIDQSLYEETSFFASHDAGAFTPSSAGMSPDTAALYDEATVHAVAYAPSLDLGDQIASTTFVPGRSRRMPVTHAASHELGPE